ncbi:MAG: type II secretion system major pseudopilin GspG [Planctomycetota bacterium]
MTRKKQLHIAAFTLIELMVVIVIIGILAGVVVANYMGRTEVAQEAAIKHDISTVMTALKMFKMDCGRYPESLEELYMQPADASKWHGPYLETPAKDPWGREYIYEYTGESPVPFIIKTNGRDGTEGGEGEDKDYSNIDSFEDIINR